MDTAELIGVVGFLVALAALAIALWQVRDARRVSRLQGDVSALGAFLSVELARKEPDAQLVKRLLKLIFERVRKFGSDEVLTEMTGLFTTEDSSGGR